MHCRARHTAAATLLLALSLFDCAGKDRDFSAGHADAGRSSSGGAESSRAGNGGDKPATAGNRGDEPGGAGNGGDEPAGAGDGGDAMGGHAGEVAEAGSAGQSDKSECATPTDCPKATSPCMSVSCFDGVCGQAPVGEHTSCTGGTCDAAGQCVASTCGSKQLDGDETGVDCGGSCATCANGEGCAQGDDCKSGVCTNQKCIPSGCTDGVKNGTETDVDCGGSCGSKCALGSGCASVSDCAITAGDKPESVRCLQQACTSTKPPGSGIRYYQDFDPSRLITDGAQCNAESGVCLQGNGGAYPMFGLDTSGVQKKLTQKLFTTAGAVGSGGKFDGTFCLSRIGTSLSFNDANAFTAMAWVKSTRSSSPWESTVVGAPAHYFIAVDANPVSQRFVAALATTHAAKFDYAYATSTGQIPSGEWHHLAQVYDNAAASMSLYLDGTKIHSRTQTGTVTAGAVDALIGCQKDGKLSQFFIGTLDEVVLYVRALTATELSDYARRSKPE